MKGDIADAKLWQSMAFNDGFQKGRSEGYRAGLEAAAKECDERATLNGAIERVDPEYNSAGNRMDEALECAAAIRALAKEGR